MTLENWKKGLQNHLPILEALLKKITMKQMGVELADTDTAEFGPDKAAEILSEPNGVLVKAVESLFDSELYLLFDAHWIPLLSKAVLDEEQTQVNEITQDLIKEFADSILNVLGTVYDELGVQIDINEISLLKPGQVQKALTDNKLYSAKLNIQPKFEISDEEALEMSLRVVMSKPAEERLSLITTAWGEKNPLLNGDFINIGKKGVDNFNFSGLSAHASSQRRKQGKGLKMKGQNVEFEEFDKKNSQNNNREMHNLDLLKDVEMVLSVELGRREMSLGQILQVVKGSVIELEKLAGEPVEILVNGRKIAEGDVVVIDEHFGVRISNLLASHDKMKAEAS